MKILVCNAGSTSLKYKLFDMPSERVISEGKIERVGDKNGGFFSFKNNIAEKLESDNKRVIPDYAAGIRAYLDFLVSSGAIKSLDEICAVGFKTVLSKDHYGVHIIDEAVLKGMEDYMVVAPAHNRCYLQAIRTFMDVMPETKLVGVFETAFHQTLDKEAYIYPLPYEWYEKYGIRRFGYHGASHSYIADVMTQKLGNSYRAVSCHLGGSSSLAAIVNGECRETSFGMSLQCGLPQSSRAGDFDPYLIFFLMKQGLSAEEIEESLQKKSGLLGISGVSNDLRDIEQAAETNDRAKLAIDIYIRELIRYISGYAGLMGGIDAICFTGGIGENSETVRSRVMEKLAFLGIIKGEKPRRGEISCITAHGSKVSVWVVPANEELGVARKTFSAIK